MAFVLYLAKSIGAGGKPGGGDPQLLLKGEADETSVQEGLQERMEALTYQR